MLQHQISIFFGQEAYTELHSFLTQVTHSKVFVLVDENTQQHCLPLFKSHFQQDFEVMQISSGENFKNIDSTQQLWQELTDKGADRKSILINLGGGVITDIGGFVALTFKRGIKFINIPTTLLGMVDAAIGGKTGIDFNGLKNQIGIISQPEMVLIDVEYLKTLPKREMISGMAEVYKYGLIADEQLWDSLINMNPWEVDEKVIKRAAEIKKQVVSEDVNETGLRKTLNFGHTLGHAIETHFMSKPLDKQLLHGEAVAVGMIMAAHLSYQTQGFPEKGLDEITKVLISNYQKIELSDLDIESVFELLKHDKKNLNGKINFVLLKDIGKSVWDCQVSDEQVFKSIEYYLNY